MRILIKKFEIAMGALIYEHGMRAKHLRKLRGAGKRHLLSSFKTAKLVKKGDIKFFEYNKTSNK